MAFDLSQYETVEDRLHRFWEDHKNGRILTEIYFYDETRVVFRAEIYFNDTDTRPTATGYAEEIRGASPVNKTSHLENGETSAIGRGLANCGYAPKGARPSREEMEKVQRMTTQPAKPSATLSVKTTNNGGVNVRGTINADPNKTASEAQTKFISDLVKKLEFEPTIVKELTGTELNNLTHEQAQTVLNGLLAVKKGTGTLLFSDGKATIQIDGE